VFVVVASAPLESQSSPRSVPALPCSAPTQDGSLAPVTEAFAAPAMAPSPTLAPPAGSPGATVRSVEAEVDGGPGGRSDGGQPAARGAGLQPLAPLTATSLGSPGARGHSLRASAISDGASTGTVQLGATASRDAYSVPSSGSGTVTGPGLPIAQVASDTVVSAQAGAETGAGAGAGAGIGPDSADVGVPPTSSPPPPGPMVAWGSAQEQSPVAVPVVQQGRMRPSSATTGRARSLPRGSGLSEPVTLSDGISSRTAGALALSPMGAWGNHGHIHGGGSSLAMCETLLCGPLLSTACSGGLATNFGGSIGLYPSHPLSVPTLRCESCNSPYPRGGEDVQPLVH
jgi:hypothetical protein